MSLDWFFRFVTDLGDSTITGALALTLALYLSHFNQRRAAFAMLASFGAVAVIIALGKIVLYSKCAVFAVVSDLKSPSGHTALSLSVYGTAALIIASSHNGPWRRMTLTGAGLLILLIAISRVTTGAHSPADVIAGLCVGAAVCWCVWRFLLKGHAVHCPWWPAALICAVVVAVLYGFHMPGEKLVRLIAGLVRHHANPC